MLPDDQPPTVTFTVLAQLCDRQAKGMEMGAALLIKWRGKNFDFDFDPFTT